MHHDQLRHPAQLIGWRDLAATFPPAGRPARRHDSPRGHVRQPLLFYPVTIALALATALTMVGTALVINSPAVVMVDDAGETSETVVRRFSAAVAVQNVTEAPLEVQVMTLARSGAGWASEEVS